MAVRGSRGPDQRELQKEQAREQRDQQNIQAGMDAQKRQLRDLWQNPEVLETLSNPDFAEGAQTDKAWLKEMVEEHLHRDQVFSIYDERDVWEKQWLNRNVADRIIMSYPCPESRTSNERVKNVRERIHGHAKEPLTPDEKRKLRATMEQKTDREKRAKGGKFMDLVLSEVVRSEQSTRHDDESSGLWQKLVGGG